MGRVSAAVIGSGFGGLALAIRLQAAGCRTVIFEKRDQAGGRAYVYRDQVSEILTRCNRVVGIATQTGERHEFDLVASNAWKLKSCRRCGS